MCIFYHKLPCKPNSIGLRDIPSAIWWISLVTVNIYQGGLWSPRFQKSLGYPSVLDVLPGDDPEFRLKNHVFKNFRAHGPFEIFELNSNFFCFISHRQMNGRMGLKASDKCRSTGLRQIRSISHSLYSLFRRQSSSELNALLLRSACRLHLSPIILKL